MKFTLADKITFARLLLLPVALVFYIIGQPWAYFASAFVVVIMGFSDYFDGVVARNMNQVTKFGSFLDPVSDKVTVVAGLIALLSHYHNLILLVATLVITLREVIVSALREFMALSGNSSKVSVVYIAKCKTFFQAAAILVLIIASSGITPHWFYLTGLGLLVCAAILTVWSLCIYIYSAKDELLS
jgi:CDP-diacylglycerol---glycerol-3-phosphate 3-phosphatidyltransferase